MTSRIGLPRAGRFAIIAGFLAPGIGIEHIGPADMGGLIMLFTDFGQNRFCFLLRFNMKNQIDKARLFDFKFGFIRD
jgi:hypothetical protein